MWLVMVLFIAPYFCAQSPWSRARMSAVVNLGAWDPGAFKSPQPLAVAHFSGIQIKNCSSFGIRK